MRIVSLLPSATEIICSLGLRDQLVGITHECDYPLGIEDEKTILIESCLGPNAKDLSPEEIDRQICETVSQGKGVYNFKPGLLHELQPDLVITQGLCDVCAVPASVVKEAISSLPTVPQLISLDPMGLTDILKDIIRVGRATNCQPQAEELVLKLQARLDAITKITNPIPEDERPRIACIEWSNPIYAGGHWVPEQVSMAGGIDVLATAGVPSQKVAWQTVVDAKPDIIIMMPCGYDIEKTMKEVNVLKAHPGWGDLPAVQQNQVYAVNANAYFSRPGPRTVNGVEVLANILHPKMFSSDEKEWNVCSTNQ